MSKNCCGKCGTSNTDRKCGAPEQDRMKANFRCGGTYHPDPNYVNPLARASNPPHPNPALFQMRNPPPPGFRGTHGET